MSLPRSSDEPCLQCGHAAVQHHTTPGLDGDTYDAKPVGIEYGAGPCWECGWGNYRCQHYVGHDKLDAARILAAHGIGHWKLPE